MKNRCVTIYTVLFSVLITAAAPVLAQPPVHGGPTAPTDAQVRELEQQLKSLQQQLDEMKAAPDAAARRRLQQQNWQGMQSYMGQMHDRWGMGEPWMAGRPWSMCGPGMMGSGSMSWPVPPGMSADQYSLQMSGHMQRMQEQMAKIARATDPQERQRLMQEHWQGMYQDMQGMRGMGWMFESDSMMGRGMMGGDMMHGRMMQRAPTASSNPLPDSASAGATLVSTYCAQCHAAPQPALHSANEWVGVTQRMRAHIDGGWRGIKTPSEQEMKSIVAYMQKHARQ